MVVAEPLKIGPSTISMISTSNDVPLSHEDSIFPEEK